MVESASALLTAAGGAAGGLVWAVRGRSSSVFAPSVWRGDRSVPRVALTFDDGPSESTGEILRILEEYRVPATFFQCGFHVRRLSGAAAEVAAAGHEIGNHTENHYRLSLRSPEFIAGEVAKAQEAITSATGCAPRLFRAPYGVRWFGLRAAQAQFGLMGVMWTTIGRDWALRAPAIAARVLRGAANGAIFCLHDGRELQVKPDIRETVEAVRRIVPGLLERGLQPVSVSALVGE